MRIGINCLDLGENIGGLRQYFHRLFRELLTNDNINEYVFFYRADNIEELNMIGVERWREGARQVGSNWEILCLLGDIDVYFCPLNCLSPKPLPVASVVQLADIQEAYFPQFFSQDVLDWRRVNYSRSTRIADAVITLSDFSKLSIVQHHTVDPDKVFVSHLAADEFLSGELEPLCLSFSLPERFLFYPANNWLHKNHGVLLEALLLLKTEFGLSIPAVMTGHKVENGYPLDSKIREYELSDQVFNLGYISPKEIKVLYRKASLLCFPSLFEGFGMPVLEAMLSECPVTCSESTSLPEICGDAALYFNPTDPSDIAKRIKELWESDVLCKEMITKGKLRASKFSAKEMAAVHLRAFKYAYENFSEESRVMYRQMFFERLNAFENDTNYLKVINEVESSLSWRITSPLRWIGKMLIRAK